MTSVKAELRNAALKRRDAVNLETRASYASRLAEICPKLVHDFRTGEPRPVTSLFAAIGSEPDPMPFALSLHAADCPLVLPVDYSHGTPLLYRRWSPGDRLAIGPLGIAEPLASEPELEPDVLFIPLAGFDRRGHRLGYGAGNVDGTLRSLRARKRVRAIGLAFGVQEIDRIPNEPHDQPVDIVVTESEVLTFA